MDDCGGTALTHDQCPGSSITSFYKHLAKGKGKSKAIIAASNKLLKAIYWILMDQRAYYSRNNAQ